MDPVSAAAQMDIPNPAFLSVPAVQLAFLFFSGLLYCFVGYRLFKVMLMLTGFLLAGGVSAAIVSVGFPDGWLVPGVVGVICGILGAGVLLFLYRLGVFIVGAAFGSLLAFQLLQTAGPTWAGVAIVASGLLAGGLALLVERPVLSIAMAVIGSWLIVATTTVFILGGKGFQLNPDEVTPPIAWALLLCWLVLTVFGLFTQYAKPAKHRAEK
jgi:hypothetical protein